MRTVVGIALGIFTYVGAAFALAGDACDVAAHLVHADAELPRVSAAISKAKSLTVVVAGTTSSTLPGAAGPALAYPARFEAALQKKLPGVAVKVISLAKPRQTAADMAEAFPKVLKDEKPALVIWQTGTADAMRGVGAEAFQATLEGAVDMGIVCAASVLSSVGDMTGLPDRRELDELLADDRDPARDTKR